MNRTLSRLAVGWCCFVWIGCTGSSEGSPCGVGQVKRGGTCVSAPTSADGDDVTDNNDGTSVDPDHAPNPPPPGPAPAPEPTPPPVLTLLSSAPVDAALDVARNTDFTLTFSAELQPSTVSSDNVILKSGNVAVNTTVSVTGAQLTVSPGDKLWPAAPYTLTVSQNVKGTAGETLTQAVELQFVSVDGGWSGATPVENDDNRSMGGPQVAADTLGNVFAVFHRVDLFSEPLSVRYVSGSGWSLPVRVESSLNYDASGTQLTASGPTGALAVWQQSDGVRTNIWANHYVAGFGWGSVAVLEEDDTGNAQAPRVAVDAAGNAMAVWRQFDGTRFNVWSNRYLAGIGWTGSTLVETENSGSVNWLDVAMDAAGNAIAVWAHWDGSRYNIWANRYAVGVGWGTAALIENNNLGTAVLPSVVVDAEGSAIAVWQQSDGTRDNIWAVQYQPGAGWQAPVLIEANSTGNAERPQVAIDGRGNALAVWEQSDGTRMNAWANRYVKGVGWKNATEIENIAGDARSLAIGADLNGNAFAVWQQYDGFVYDLWANRFVEGAGWGTPTPLESSPGDVTQASIVVDRFGDATVIWRQVSGMRGDIWSRRFE